MKKSTFSFQKNLNKARQGDLCSLDLIWQHFSQELSNQADSLVNSKVDCPLEADDLLQFTFLDVAGSIHQFQGSTEASFLKWLTQVLNHNFQDELKKYKGGTKRDRTREESLQTELPNDETVRPDDQYLSDDPEEMEKMLQILTDLQREAFTRKHLEHIPVWKIAEQMNKTPSAVSALIYRAKQKIRKFFPKE